MPYKSRWKIDIPDCSLPTYVFKSATYVDPDADKLALADPARPESRRLTRGEFRLWAQRIALGLQRSPHFHKGDRVLVFSPNNIFVPALFMGVVCAGGIFTGANPTFVARELAHQLRDSGATYLICFDGSIDTGIDAASQAGLDPAERVFVFNDRIYDGKGQRLKGCKYWDALVAPADDARHFQWDSLTGPGESNTTLALNYSSGTTGVPKGVEISHKNYVANVMQIHHLATLEPDYQAQQARAVWLCFLPMYHAYGQVVFIALAQARRIPVYLMDKFDFIKSLEYTQRYRISSYGLVPPIAILLAKSPAVDKYDLSSIDSISCGSAPLSRDVCEQVERRLGNRLNMKQGWGMTECTCGALGWDPIKISTSAAVGEPIANCELKIVAEDGLHEITGRGPEARGELWVRGPNVMKGYWRNPSATAATIVADGWLKTGDVAYVDGDGHFHIVDRIKELIKVKSQQVAPAELEGLLLEHPGIGDAAVIGVPTPEGDERPRAFIVRQANSAGSQLTEREVQAFIEAKVVRYKRLTGGVEFMSAIPKNPSGKVLRRQLRDAAKNNTRQAASRL